jgi:hypothetical protein
MLAAGTLAVLGSLLAGSDVPTFVYTAAPRYEAAGAERFPEGAHQHSVFRNNGGGKFQAVSSDAGPFFASKSVGRGACFADYDDDGKVDAFLVNLGAPAVLLHNTSPSTGHWLMVKLVGVKSNRDGIGARVEVEAGGLNQWEERVAGSGYLSQNDGRLHFGLGARSKVDRITVTWPGGGRQVVEGVAADQVVTVTEK